MSLKKFMAAEPARVAAVLLALGAGLWLMGRSTGFIPCQQNCGETFDALLALRNYELTGLKYGLIHDLATSGDPRAHPYFYTHNVNIGSFEYVALDILGLRAFEAKQTVTLLIFLGGLGYAFAAARSWTGSSSFAWLVLIFLSTEYFLNLSYAFNPLRGWAGLAFFGVLFHAGAVLNPEGTRLRRWGRWLALAAFAAIAFASGYDFWMATLMLALAGVGLKSAPGSGRRAVAARFAGVLAVFALPPALRQLQIIAVLGFDFWWKDLWYTAVIKTSFLSAVAKVPGPDDVDAWYRAHDVVRLPAFPQSNVRQIVSTFKGYMIGFWIPVAGRLALAACGAAAGASVIGSFLTRVSSRFRAWAARPGRIDAFLGTGRAHLGGVAAILASATLGTALGMYFFAPYSIHFYVKHYFPLLVFGMSLAKAAVAWSGLAGLRTAVADRASRSILPAVAAFGLLAAPLFDHAWMQARNLKRHPVKSFGWIDAVKRHEGETFAVSWIPNCVSVYTRTWAVALKPGLEGEIARRVREHEPPFRTSDYFIFAEKNKDAAGDLYVRPRYWLYFATTEFSGNPADLGLSPDAVRKKFPTLPVAGAGPDFVILDMGPAYSPPPP